MLLVVNAIHALSCYTEYYSGLHWFAVFAAFAGVAAILHFEKSPIPRFFAVASHITLSILAWQ